jgi:Cys-rich four helix bundle protein (predicted Tat secretion target)
MKNPASKALDHIDHHGTTSRRNLVMGAASLFVWLSAGLATPGSAQHKSPNQALVAAARRCEDVGNICLAHCIRLTKAGDKSLGDCMRAVQAMLPVCGAVRRLATQDARRLKDLAKVCMDICSDCEAECRKHESHHVQCKNCAEACAATVRECKALIAA